MTMGTSESSTASSKGCQTGARAKRSCTLLAQMACCGMTPHRQPESTYDVLAARTSALYVRRQGSE